MRGGSAASAAGDSTAATPGRDAPPEPACSRASRSQSVLTGDESLDAARWSGSRRPCARWGRGVRHRDGHAPVSDRGRLRCTAIRYRAPVPSAQVKSAILLAGLAAEGDTVVEEAAATRDHTERALAALGGPVLARPAGSRCAASSTAASRARCRGIRPRRRSSSAAAALTGSRSRSRDVGLNPTRTRFLEVLARMGVATDSAIEREEVGEPVGSSTWSRCDGLVGTRVEPDELPLVIDEVPVLAALAAHARGETWFLGAAELRVKESDRIAAIAAGLRALGGHAGDEGADLVVAGGGLAGGSAPPAGDHRMAMAFVVAALAADGPVARRGRRGGRRLLPRLRRHPARPSGADRRGGMTRPAS